MTLCFCGSGHALKECCAPLIDGQAAKTAEALMRSRYTAHVLGRLDYIEKTSAPEALKDFDRAEMQEVLDQTQWKGLRIGSVVAGGEQDTTGQVDFSFCFIQNGHEYTQRELASFCRVDGAWCYQKSDFPKEKPAQASRIGRNDPCPCGSGKKHKKCCGT